MDKNRTQDASKTDIDPKRLEEFKNLVFSFLTRLSQVAGGAIDKLRVLMAVSLVCAAWLTFFVMSAFKLPILGAMPAALGFCFPALLIFKLHRTLKNVAGLPEQLPLLADGIREAYADLSGEGIERLGELKDSAGEKNRIKALLTMGRKLLGLKKLLSGIQAKLGETGKPEVIESVLIVAGPGFVFLMSVATISTVFLVILSLISVGIKLVFM